jgi:hypothetical protein
VQALAMTLAHRPMPPTIKVELRQRETRGTHRGISHVQPSIS